MANRMAYPPHDAGFTLPVLSSPSSTSKRVCIVGAGPSGLVCIKECLAHGFHPVCFEADPAIGGLWRFNPNVGHRYAVSPLLHVSTCLSVTESGRFLCAQLCVSQHCDQHQQGNEQLQRHACASTLAPIHAPVCPHSGAPVHKRWLTVVACSSQLMEYFQMYASKFGLEKYIQLNTRVALISKASDGESGPWEVTTDSPRGLAKQRFHAVMVCSGHHSVPRMPTFKGMGTFKGIQMHSHAYKDPSDLKGRRVVVVGVGNSGGTS